MKILISNDGPTAHYYIRKGWANAFNYTGYECKIWDINSEAAFDVFNKFEPDIFISQVYNLNNDIFKCIYNRPHLKVIMKAPDSGPLSDSIKDKYPILHYTKEQRSFLNDLKEKTGKPDFLFVHYPEEYLNDTHGWWITDGFKVVSLLNAADIIDFHNGEFDERLKCDGSICGGYWPYKAKTLDRYILRLCTTLDLNIKIFGNQPWPGPEYCGFLPNNMVKNLFVSTKINLNVHEQHSQVYGYDIIERPFKVAACGGFMISDYVEGLEDIIPELPMAKSPQEFEDMFRFYLDRPELRLGIAQNCQKRVLADHTYFNRTKTILNELDFPSTNIDKIISKLKGNND